MAEHRNCLIIEDSKAIGEIAARMARDLGFTPTVAGNADEALAAYQDAKPVFLLLDWDLPNMAALDVLKAFVEVDAESRPVIILCTTENDPQQYMLAKAAGADGRVMKPYDKECLAMALKEHGLLCDDAAPDDDAHRSAANRNAP